MWNNKSTVDKFEKLPRADRMLLLYIRDFNTKPYIKNLIPVRGGVLTYVPNLLRGLLCSTSKKNC